MYGHVSSRYADFRRSGVRYVQVTKEKLMRPRRMVLDVYRQLVAGGYRGPAPEFGPRWHQAFGEISQVPDLPSRCRRRAA